MLCEYFRQFGAIERVQILPERVNFMDFLPANMGTADAMPKMPERKYFAYVTFVNCLGAYDALNNSSTHIIQNQKMSVEAAFSWHQPNSEITTVLEAKAKLNKTAATNQVIYTALHKGLNDDCIIKIMSYLTLHELTDMAKFNQRFQLLAHTRRSMTITRDSGEYLHEPQITLMNLRTILRLQGFGYTLTTLKLALNINHFSKQRRAICSRLVQYCGPQLKSLSLLDSNLSSSNFEVLKPLLLQLHFLEVDLAYDFDYSLFNDRWNKLRTLRVKSPNTIPLLSSLSTQPTEFNSVTHLTLASTHKLDENLFKTISKHFPAIVELAVIIVEDIYSVLSPSSVLTDMQFIRDLVHLKRLHLTLSRINLIDTITNIVAGLTGIEHFALEIYNNRSNLPNTAAVQLLDIDSVVPKLRRIIGKVPQLKSLRLSGVAFDDDKLIDLVQNAIHLHTLSIHNSSFALTEQLLNDFMTSVIKSKVKTKGTVHKGGILTLVVDQLADGFEVSCHTIDVVLDAKI